MSDDEQLDQEARALYEARYGEETAAYWEDFNELTRANWHAVAERARQLYASPAAVEPTHELDPSPTTVGYVRAGDTLIIGSRGNMTEEEFDQFAERWHAAVGRNIRCLVIDAAAFAIASPGETVERRA